MKKEILVIKETKEPIDRRVAIVPELVEKVVSDFSENIGIKVEQSDIRCFGDDQYDQKVLVSPCDSAYKSADIYVGVKEVNIDKLIANKTYFFFSHTTKGQLYNMPLLQACIDKKITLIDYEAIRDKQGKRLIGFGDIAGVIGAYNTMKWYSEYYLNRKIKAAHELNSEVELINEISQIDFTNEKILLTGKGSVGKGAKQFLLSIGITECTIDEFVNETYKKGPVFCNIDYNDYYQDNKCVLEKFTNNIDILITGHYYNEGDPIILSEKVLERLDNLKIVGDLSCDIDGPIVCTKKPTTIAEPVYFYDKELHQICNELNKNAIVVMAVDNLPCELPLEASKRFSEKFEKVVLPEIIQEKSQILSNATICTNGVLNEKYEYLKVFLKEK